MTLIEVPARTQAPSWSLFCIAACLGLFGGLLFAAFPQIDLFVSGLFYGGDNRFLFAKPSAGNAVRELIKMAFILLTIGAVVGFALVAFASRRLFGLGFTAWIYVVLCIAVGAGLVANTIFKDQWGRARPNQVVEFGGTKKFTPPLTRSDQCERNCSFVSGEASSIFAIGFAIALLAEASRRRRLFLAAVAAGAFTGLLRIGGGGHFFSDVFFAGVFMAFVARGLYWLLFERFESIFADEGPVHRRTLHAGRRGADHAAVLMGRARELRVMERARQMRLKERVERLRLKDRARAMRRRIRFKGP
jgi:lipid A 4'-phosphatase